MQRSFYKVVETSKSSNLVREKSGNIIIFIPQSVLACLTEYNYTYNSCYTGDPALYKQPTVHHPSLLKLPIRRYRQCMSWL